MKNYFKQLNINIIDQIMSNEKFEFFNKLSNEASKFLNNPKMFYLYEINNMNLIAKKMIKKISKVYSLLDEQKKSQSINNWDLYLDLKVGKTDLSKGFDKLKKNKNL